MFITTNEQSSLLFPASRAIFNRVSKVILDDIDFALLRSVIGLETSRQSYAKLKLITTNRNLVTRIFPRFRPLTCVYFEFILIGSL